MSQKTSPEEHAVDNTPVSYSEFESNINPLKTSTSESDLESLGVDEDESSEKIKPGEQFFLSDESDMEETMMETVSKLNSEALEADSSAYRLNKESIDVSEDKDTFINNAHPNKSTKSPPPSTEALKTDNKRSSSGKGSFQEIAEEAERDVNEHKAFINTEKSIIDATESPTQALEVDDPSCLKVKSVADVSNVTGNENKVFSYKEQGTVVSNSPKSPTDAMKTLKISNSPGSSKETDHLGSGSKNTPKKLRLRNRNANNFESPYNTRRKARMMREREQSEGGSIEE